MTWDFNLKNNSRLPEEVQEVLGTDCNPDNFALRLWMGAQFNNAEGKPSLYRRNKNVSELSHIPQNKKVNWGDINFEQLANRLSNTAKTLVGPHGKLSEPIRMKNAANSRLILGLGNATVFETGINLHHIYGFPYIPGSAVKGLVRSTIINELFGGKEEDAIGEKTFCDMFGCPEELWLDDEQGKPIFKAYKGIENEVRPRSYYRINDPEKLGGDRQGCLIFFDSLPITAPVLKEDVMNPHYSPYYTSQGIPAPPADYHSPVPIPFLTVEKTTFQFLIGFKPLPDMVGFKPLPDMEGVKATGKILEGAAEAKSDSLLDVAEAWLKRALTEHGIGAKTAVGYGFFQSPNT